MTADNSRNSRTITVPVTDDPALRRLLWFAVKLDAAADPDALGVKIVTGVPVRDTAMILEASGEGALDGVTRGMIDLISQQAGRSADLAIGAKRLLIELQDALRVGVRQLNEEAGGK